ncbi:conserved Plasmodium protein, unknown function [Plasmodium berghei]|uniref:Origin recognition complex subunit 3 N-terminal domain-containing protein n=2 Tax=Plasmodium berghei TaxID=5821 RepID=A0A509AGM7_PLABA|nr:conserved Plasmodium protein, unknown function [Plasmodium berghei ANKA]CXI10512.1 conserved Plasmodium protein, unknown function [Plasmodium berghei]SCL93029.1 conserved Plasmodium protein, unknown function [Plasmodium berghei]SCM15774.1 conserved Plasmodium protein, unknown function [Plasmodium berghei]SCM17569.1 conserved Plasmodium protein, unknown function [Plasmodium berghei]SCN23026.1 conserved Plasmodium protein, unknown function [Plasmodium berghei]|eukprot:XP_034420380.1 conserved Plasmodium protein, unknown function [Plasmodium berghei ANKA]
MTEISPKSIYMGKGFILKSVNNEYLENNKNNTGNVKKRAKCIYLSKKKNIFKRYNPVVIPILNRNIKHFTKKTEKKKSSDIDIFEESELNSFLLRNRAFRLTWIKIIKLIKKEIDIQISKNLTDVFEDIYLYSISSSEYLPLVLMTAGTNVSDHEIVIDTLSYKLKEWVHKKGRHRKKRIKKNDASKALVKNVRSDNYFGLCNSFYDDSDKSNCLSSKLEKDGNCSKIKKQNNNGNVDNDLVSNSSDIINESYDSSYHEQTDSEDNANCGNDNDCDVYVCSLNSSTSNNVNSAICNIYNQLYREYKIRKLSKNMNKKNMKYKQKYSNNINKIEEDNRINVDSFYSEHNGEPSSNSNYVENEFDNDYTLNRKLINVDKLVELYNNMTEINRKCEGKVKENDFKKKRKKNKSDLSWLNGEANEFSDENFLKNYNNLELYNIENYYFNDGRKKVRVIVLIHDCEYFNINIFNGILNILINLRINNKICLSVILGVSSPFFFNNITTPSTQSKLRIKNVDILNNKLVCENICNNILFKNIIPFVINFRTIHTIKLLLYKNNQSISHLIHILYILTKDFYDNNLFSFLSIPINYYFNNCCDTDIENDTDNESVTEYSPYTFVRSKNKTFNTFIQYNIRNLHKKIISLCYSSNLYYFHLSYLKKKYSNILIKNYYLIHDENSDVHTPTSSSIDTDVFTLKKNKKLNYDKNENDQFDVVDNCNVPPKVNNINKLDKDRNGLFDRKLYAWKFKANTINWWLDHPFRDLVYCYENSNSIKEKKKKKTVFNIEDKLLLEPGEDNEIKNLQNLENIKEINKHLCEHFIPETVLKLLERKYAFNIAINFINIIIKHKPEYSNSLKRIEYFRKLFDNLEKAKWNNNTNILYIEELYKIAENDVKKCVHFLIDIVNPYYFKNQETLLNILKEFKKYYIKIYSLVYNLEDYLYLLKEKVYEKDKEYLINDDFSKSFSYSDSFSIYYSLLYKLDDLIEMFRKFLKQKDIDTNVCKGEFFQKNVDNTDMSNNQNENCDEKKTYKRYLTIHNTTLKVNDTEYDNDRTITIQDISDSLNMFIHDYLYLLLLPPLHYNPLAFDITIHKPDKDFTDIITRNIKGELLQTLCYNNPYKTGNLMCSCCFCTENPQNENVNSNIICDNKIYLNPYYDNISSLEDLVNLYRIYERCNKTIDLYNLFILFINIKVEKYENTIEENSIDEKIKKIPKTGQNSFLDIGILQEYYLKFIIVVTTFCYIFKILKQPNVSALLNYTEKYDYLSNNYNEDMIENDENEENAKEQVKKFLIDIKKSLQGCTSKKLLFGKLYYNNTIMSRELCLQKMMEYNFEYKRETICVNDSFKRQKN